MIGYTPTPDYYEYLSHYGVKGMKWKKPRSRDKKVISGESSIKKTQSMDDLAYEKNQQMLKKYHYDNDLRYKMKVDSERIKKARHRSTNTFWPKKNASLKKRGPVLSKHPKKMIKWKDKPKISPKIKKPTWIK